MKATKQEKRHQTNRTKADKAAELLISLDKQLSIHTPRHFYLNPDQFKLYKERFANAVTDGEGTNADQYKGIPIVRYEA